MTYKEYINQINAEFENDGVYAGIKAIPMQTVADFPMIDFRTFYRMGKTPHDAMELAKSIYYFIKPQYKEQTV